MTIFSESKHTLAFLVSEATHMRSRDRATILAGSGASRVLTAGMVVGKRTVGDAVATADAGNTGTGVMGAITVTGAAKPGIHRLVCLTAGATAAFVVIDPDGIPGPKGAVASAYSAKGLAFTLADGTPDYAVGDAFSIEVTKSGEKFLQLAVAATTGEAVAAGILIDDITALDAVDNLDGGVIGRDAEVNAAELTWPAGITAAQKSLATLQLERLGIKLV